MEFRLDMPDAIYFINGLIGLLLIILGWNVKTLFDRISKNEVKHDTLKDNLHSEMKEVYKHQDKTTDKLREEINLMSKSIREEVASNAQRTNELLVQVISQADKK